MNRTFAAAGTILALAFAFTTSARAQEPTSGPPQRLRPFGAIPPLPSQGSAASPLFSLSGEPTGDASALQGYFASAPLRLSLQNRIFPMGNAYDQCGTRGDAAGNSTGGIPLQSYTSLRLTPNLVLHGFAAGGCPIDGAIGAGISYSVRVAPSIWLVTSAGVYTAPAPAQYAGARRRSDFRIDLVKKVEGTRSLSVGVGRRGVTFGGAF